MFLARISAAEDFDLDVGRITKRWLNQLLGDPQLQQELTRWSQLYDRLLLLLDQYLHDPHTLTPDAIRELVESWRPEPGYYKCLHYLQSALVDYLEQSNQISQRVISFFQQLYGFPETAVPAHLLARDVPDKLERLVMASLEAPAESLPDLIVSEATRDSGWHGCTLYWWDAQQFLYAPVASSGKTVFLTAHINDQLRQRSAMRLDHMDDWVRLIVPLMAGRGALSFIRPHLAPTADELLALRLYALQAACLLKDLELRQKAVEERIAFNRRLIALSTHHSELLLLHDLSRIAREQTGGLLPRLLEQIMAVFVAQDGALWSLAQGGLHCLAQQGSSPLSVRLDPAQLDPLRWQSCLARRTDELGAALAGLQHSEGAIMAAPLIFAQAPLALLTLVRHPPMAPFTAADVRLLDTVANFLAPLLQAHRPEEIRPL